MKIRCTFEDTEKIRTMVKSKYMYSKFEILEKRHAFSSLNDIELYCDGSLILKLEPTSDDGYILKKIGDYVPLDFIYDVCKSIADEVY